MSDKAHPGGGRVAVLGGTGWIGRHICAALSRHGHGVLAIARNPVPHLCDHEFLPLDLTAADPDRLVEVLRSERTEVVINAMDGANTTDGWDRTETELTDANVEAVHRLLAAVGALPWRPRVVHIGTIHEYGPVGYGEPVGESTVPSPVSLYARTKLAGSTAVLDAARKGTVDGVVLRVSNVCGPHPSPPSFPGKLLSAARAAAAGGRPELSIADAKRDFVDVRDVAEAALLAARAPVTARPINIGSGVAVDIRDLVAQFLAVVGLPPDAVKEGAGPVPSLGGAWIQSDIRLARRLLGWFPRTSLRDSLQGMWDAR
ncbi:NAD(P)-dependent oxidoreductase [Actinomadura sp. KC345]|uniref:NAD-dependent epimerase/dehydratase family protein n=1 Tax=Actinomadura sp. KC345 TaxID=2530371 RepID=UPI001043971D|nr:NAD(P)-dependent oxidoreductase [Actinomadura sp. KC345]TDC44514.1 NAD(P)-dependent oxidoreductase [Actinomadura sp. KC345]